MTTAVKDPILVVIQLTGGNDYVNTIVPYTSDTYYDNRSSLSVEQDQVLPINDEFGFNPAMAPLAPIQGISLPHSMAA